MTAFFLAQTNNSSKLNQQNNKRKKDMSKNEHDKNEGIKCIFKIIKSGVFILLSFTHFFVTCNLTIILEKLLYN